MFLNDVLNLFIMKINKKEDNYYIQLMNNSQYLQKQKINRIQNTSIYLLKG
ncbi:hypothetical protein DFQ06_0351 [Algibacter lectus]|uniref:Uncharacterized protein n=1 Tax=Algibacter lectus TaxID=221126 RepID=A0A4R8MHH5_9FLAO|nr:hypothetical protein DFQ06_0351 [Algibacter lectus]